ncbi:YbdK family carboxylate-amine ligase [Candidatus Marinimicrobia bacterium]|nr:YbdK family carboxylate-amine ligase [Candidatus Neomarinimicrobiota bacterium]
MTSKIFKHKNKYTIGVEEEYMICHPSSGDLVNRANEIMASVDKELKDRFSYELLLSEIEINTSVCKDVNQAITELSDLRNYVRLLGEKLDYRIGISGTHPTAQPENQNFVENESYNWVANQLHYYAERNITFATHVHVAVSDGDTAIHVTNSLRQWIAPLLALSSNSPFYAGEYTHFKSARTMQFGAFPRTNIPPHFKSYSHYEKMVDDYLSIDSISKSRHIWWKLRPHMDFGTIEFRMLDAQRSLKRTRMFIALAQALVYQSSSDLKNNKLSEDFSSEFLSDSLWKATRFDFSSKIIDVSSNKVITMSEKIEQMVEYATPALRMFGNDFILSEIDDIINTGTEGDIQLDVFNNSGMDGLKEYLMDDVEYNIL